MHQGSFINVLDMQCKGYQILKNIVIKKSIKKKNSKLGHALHIVEKLSMCT
jgi:hypothetical protein